MQFALPVDPAQIAPVANAYRDRLERLTEAAVERGDLSLAELLIGLLDAADGDADFEDDTEDADACEDLHGGEPLLACGDNGPDADQRRYGHGISQHDLEGDDADREPELGWSNPSPGEWPGSGDDADHADVQAHTTRHQPRRHDVWPQHHVARDGTVYRLVRGSDGLVRDARPVSAAEMAREVR